MDPLPEMAELELEESHDQMEEEGGPPHNGQINEYLDENQTCGQV